MGKLLSFLGEKLFPRFYLFLINVTPEIKLKAEFSIIKTKALPNVRIKKLAGIAVRAVAVLCLKKYAG